MEIELQWTMGHVTVPWKPEPGWHRHLGWVVPVGPVDARTYRARAFCTATPTRGASWSAPGPPRSTVDEAVRDVVRAHGAATDDLNILWRTEPM